MSPPIHRRCLALVYDADGGSRCCGARLLRARGRGRMKYRVEAVRQVVEMGWDAERVAEMMERVFSRRCWRHGRTWGRRPR